jgi:hypothetical protein
LYVTANPGEEKELGSSVVESCSLVVGEELGFGDVADCKEVVSRRGGGVACNTFREVGDDLVDVRDHIDVDGPVCRKIKGHTEVFMDRPTSDGEFFVGRVIAV